MSTIEILAQLPTLTPADREKVRSQLDAIDAAAPLSPEEKRLIEERVAAYRQNPEASVSWAVAEEAIRKQIGL
jgi:Putative addiction module component